MYMPHLKQKLTNYYYFVIFNSILACIFGVSYWFKADSIFATYSSLSFQLAKVTNWLDILFITTTHFAIISIIVFAIGIIILPTIYLKSKPANFIPLILFSLLLAILIRDTRVFHFDQVHLFTLISDTFINTISTKKALSTIGKILAFTFIFIWLIAKIQRWINTTNYFTNKKIGAIFSALVFVSSVISVLNYQLATKERQQQLLDYMQYIPLNINESDLVKKTYKKVNNGKLQYPLKPLERTNVITRPNILIIAMDAWRADCFNEKDSPNLWQFSQQGAIFANHFSGGNHTSHGLFSLFYGIPAVYMRKFEKQQITALFFSQLNNLGYQMDIFTADDVIKHFIDGTYNLYHTTNKNVALHKVDKQITDNWLKNYAKLNKTKPWFSFVFYDSLHGPDFPDNYSKILKPVAKCSYKKFVNKYGKEVAIGSYKVSVHYIDSLANKILQQLKDNNDLENTIVIITADHGCELDDNNQGEYGYWSNFTNCQVQVPLAIVYPRHNSFNKQTIETKITTHYDIAPTLMKNFLGINNNTTDYSIGKDLTSNFNNSDWRLTTSSQRYTTASFAIATENKILKVNSSCNYNLLDKFNNIIFGNNTINTDYLNQALEYIIKFIQ